MQKINVLPKHIAQLIAAGEVVERPASVVKELCENSIDAGSSFVTVEIKNGGISYIRITDNGCGIFRADVQNAFLSHATSKLKTAEDLDKILTLGFRGEALPSISTVAKVELFTKSKEEAVGSRYEIHGGEEIDFCEAGCPDGTTIVVRDLFYNTPARMKFLKKDVSEGNAVADVVDKLAISHPEISFRLIRDGRQTLLTPGDNKLISAIHSVFGKEFTDSLIKVDYTLEYVRVTGYISKPSASRPTRAMQFFFLDGRYIKSRACACTIENAYKNSIMVGKFPACVLNISVPVNSVDVNVHPAKTQVRFSDERRVSSAVYYAVKTALNELDTRVQVDLASLTKKTQPTASQLYMAQREEKNRAEEAIPEKQPDFWQSMPSAKFKNSTLHFASPEQHNSGATNSDEPDLISSFKQKQAVNVIVSNIQNKAVSCNNEPRKAVEINADEQIEPIYSSEPEAQVLPNIEIVAEKPKSQLRILGEAFKTYILCEYDEKLYIIDKHAAHERVIFNQMKNAKGSQPSQVLLMPVTVTLSKLEYNVILENLDVFKNAGFLIEDFGGGSVIIRECPMLLDFEDAENVVLEMAQNLSQSKIDVQSQIIDKIFHTAACKAAIKAGYKNSEEELLELANRVLLNDDVRYCPHGRPVLVEMSKYDLEKQFKRV